MGEVYKLETLAEKYNSFIDPCYEIKINGKKLNEDYFNQELVVDIKSGYEASSATFIIKNAFLINKDEDFISTSSDLSSYLRLGNKVEIFIGYKGSNLILVFVGYIDSIYIDYERNERAEYLIECLDAKGIMMNSIHSETRKSVKKLSLAVEDVLKKYGSLVKTGKNIDKSDMEVTFPIEQHNESDYDFIVRLAKKLNYDFYIINGEAIFKPTSKRDKSVIVKYHINQFVKDFYFRLSLKNIVKSVTVRGNNEKDPTKVYEAEVESYSKSSENGKYNVGNISKILNSRVTRTIVDYNISSEADAKNKAEAHLEEVSFDLGRGYIVTNGFPQIFPGKVVEIDGFGSPYNRKYYVTGVKHIFNEKNYTTRCEIEVNFV